MATGSNSAPGSISGIPRRLRRDDGTERLSFQYMLFERKTMIMISMKGTLGDTDLKKLIQCETDLKKYSLNRVVLDFQQLQEVEKGAVRALHHFNESLRSKPVTLRFCHLQPELAEALLTQQIIRSGELRSSLDDAMKSMSFQLVRS